MRLLLLLFHLLRVVESNQQVLGFLGESVTLSPTVDLAQQNISSIKWLILSNDTWIATYQHGKTKTDHFWPYRERLHLDISSGALTINNLIRQDAMQYVVEVDFQGGKEVSHKVVLRVEQRLAQPRVAARFNVLENGSCNVLLQCSSPDPHVNFTWSAKPHATNRTRSEWFHARSTLLWASVGLDHEVGFTCNTTGALESASTTLVVACHDPIQEPAKTSAMPFGHGVLLGSFLGILLAMITYIFREKIEASIRYLTGKGCRSNKHTSVATDEDKS